MYHPIENLSLNQNFTFQGITSVKGITPLISAAGGKFVPVKFPIQIIRPQSGAGATAAGSSGAQVGLVVPTCTDFENPVSLCE